MGTTNLKAEARKLIERLPENSTWEDLMPEIYVRPTIESGRADSRAGSTSHVEQVREEFGLKKGRSSGRIQRATLSPPFTPPSRGIPLNTPCTLWTI